MSKLRVEDVITAQFAGGIPGSATNFTSAAITYHTAKNLDPNDWTAIITTSLKGINDIVRLLPARLSSTLNLVDLGNKGAVLNSVLENRNSTNSEIASASLSLLSSAVDLIQGMLKPPFLLTPQGLAVYGGLTALSVGLSVAANVFALEGDPNVKDENNKLIDALNSLEEQTNTPVFEGMNNFFSFYNAMPNGEEIERLENIVDEFSIHNIPEHVNQLELIHKTLRAVTDTPDIFTTDQFLLNLDHLVSTNKINYIGNFYGKSPDEIFASSLNSYWRFALVNSLELVFTPNGEKYQEFLAEEYSQEFIRAKATMMAEVLAKQEAQSDDYTGYVTGHFFQDLSVIDPATLQGVSHFTADVTGDVDNYRKFIFGSSQSDAIYGGHNNDMLFGQGGDDTITLGGGDDYTEGGEGNDTYIYNTGDGYDTIVDTGGTIVFDGETLTGGTFDPTRNAYVSDDGKFEYRFEGYNLIINDQLTLENGALNLSEFGITLENNNAYSDILNNGAKSLLPIDQALQALTELVENRTYSLRRFRPPELGNEPGYNYSGSYSLNSFSSLTEAGQAATINSSAIASVESKSIRAKLMGIDKAYDWAVATLTQKGIHVDPNRGIIENQYSTILATGQSVVTREFSDHNVIFGTEFYSKVHHFWHDNTSTSLEVFYEVHHNGDDIIHGTSNTDIIWGINGNDEIYGYGGNDQIQALFGEITVDAGDGDDYVDINESSYVNGSETIISSATTNASVLLGDGNDAILFDGDYLDLDTGNGNDNIEIKRLEDGAIIKNSGGMDWLKFSSWWNGDTSYLNENVVVEFDKPLDDYVIGISSNIISPTNHEQFVPGERANYLKIADSSGNGFFIDIPPGTLEELIAQQSGLSAITFRFADGDKTLADLYPVLLKHAFYGTDENDIIQGTDGSETLTGLAGDDTIHSGRGNDKINAGEGNDNLIDTAGDDTYTYHIGDGNDIIDDQQGEDRLVLSGIGWDDIVVSHINFQDLIIEIKPSGDTITLKNALLDNNQHIESILFTDSAGNYLDGTKTNALIQNLLAEHRAQTRDQDNTFNGSNGTDWLDGGAGDDSLNGGMGNDVLTGGTGDDTLNGGAGNDKYFFTVGDGKDTIIDTSGNDSISFFTDHNTTAQFIKQGNHIVIQLLNSAGTLTGDQVTIIDGLSEGSSGIESILVGGETLTWSEITRQALTFNGDDRDDNITGTVSNESFLLKGGNNTVNGGGGNDTIITENGHDFITTHEGNDSINAGDGSNRIISGGGNDSISTGRDNDDINTGAGDDVISSGNGDDIIRAEDGDDSIISGAGDDLIYAGEGDDTINAGGGNDILRGGTGSDTYRIAAWDGNDTIAENQGIANDFNIIEFTVGLTPEDINVAAAQDGSNSLIIQILNTGERITVENWFSDIEQETFANPAPIQQFHFSDGTIWDTGTIREHLVLLNFGKHIVGEHQDDDTEGTFFNDSIATHGGNDTIYGNGGNDLINSGAGDDYVEIVDGNNIVHLGEGDDEVIAYDSNNQLFGDAGDDYIEAGDGDNLIQGGTGNDEIYLGNGNNRIIAGDGNDEIDAGNGDNIIEAGSGNDILYLGDGDNYIDAGEGDNRIDLGEGDNRIITGDGDNEIDARGGKNRITTGAGDDDIDLGDGDNFIDAGNGENDIETDDGNSIIIAGSDDDEIDTGDGNNHIVSGAGNDEIEVGDGNNIIESGAGHDIIETDDGNNHIQAGSGNDEIETGDGNDIVRGGTGDDVMAGGAGNDHYLYELGDGNDIIIDYEGTDLIRFGTGIAQEDISLSFEGDDLVIHLTDSGSIRYESWFTQSEHSLNGFSFTDNQGNSSYVSLASYFENVSVTGTNNSDFLNFGHFSQGLAFSGGLGNDVIIGTMGNDTYHYQLGDGNDQIIDTGGSDILYLGQGIQASDVTVTADAQRLYLNFTDGGRITLNNWLSESTIALEGIVFDDGTYWTNQAIGRNIQTIGSAGDDRFHFSHVQNDMRFNAGAGNDVINAGSNNDKFVFNLGDGHDILTDAGGIDELILGEGISADDITITATQTDIVLHISNTDSVTLRNWFNGTHVAFEGVRFADGTTWSHQGLGEMAIVQGSSTSDSFDYSNSNNNLSFRGNAGNDLLLGGFAQDRYYFGGHDGNNVIRDAGGTDFIYFDQGISTENLTVTVLGSHLKLETNTDGNPANDTEIIIENWFGNDNTQSSNTAQPIEGILFADGSYWSNEFTESQISAVNGTFRDDTWNFQHSNKGLAFSGAHGNDTITGTQFNDVYHYDRDHGFDVITDTGGIDQLLFGSNIDSQNVSFIMDNNDLLVQIKREGSSLITGEIRIKNAANSDSIDQIQFNDGTQFDVSDIIDSFEQPLGDSPEETIALPNAAASPQFTSQLTSQPAAQAQQEQQWAQLMDSMAQFNEEFTPEIEANPQPNSTDTIDTTDTNAQPSDKIAGASEVENEGEAEKSIDIEHMINMLNHALIHERASEFNDIETGDKSGIYQTPPPVPEWEVR